MSWKSIVAGVDGSPESLHAAALACKIADAARTKCQLVHAVSDMRLARAVGSVPVYVQGLFERVLADVRRDIAVRLQGVVPSAAVRALEVRTGRAAQVLAEAAVRHGAALVVLGGKRHGPLARVLSGSTAHYLARTLDVPIMVTVRKSGLIERVLVAVDLSPAARPTLTAAAALARQLGAELHVMHVVEPIRYPQVVPRTLDREIHFRESVEMFKRLASTFSGVAESDMVVRRGSAASAIAKEAARWKADVVVVGSQGKGFLDRLLIGSTTEWLLNLLPTSLLVVPAARSHLATRTRRRVGQARSPRPIASRGLTVQAGSEGFGAAARDDEHEGEVDQG